MYFFLHMNDTRAYANSIMYMYVPCTDHIMIQWLIQSLSLLELRASNMLKVGYATSTYMYVYAMYWPHHEDDFAGDVDEGLDEW